MSDNKGYYATSPPQYPQQAAYGQPAYGQPAYGQPPAPGQAASYQPGYPPAQGTYPPQPSPYGQQPYPVQPGQPAPGGYYAQPSPQPQVIIHQTAPQQHHNNNSKSDDLCFGCALGACLCCCLDGLC